MKLKDKINEDLKLAIKDGDKLKLQTIRSIRALIIEFEKNGSGKEFNEEEEIKLLSTAAKKRKDSIEQFEKGGRPELAESEKTELAILEKYLPKLMSEEEIKKVVDQKKTELGIADKSQMGQFIGAVMQELKGKADGALVKKVVEEALEN